MDYNDDWVYCLAIGTLIAIGGLLGLTVFIETQQIVWAPLFAFFVIAIGFTFVMLIDCRASNTRDS